MAVMPSFETLALGIGDPSGAADARRQVGRLTSRLGFGAGAAGGVAIAVTELATNLWKHAGRGELIAQPLHEGTRPGIDLIAVDQGPGIANVAAAMRDGYSTAGSPGTGLGALARLADGFDIHSAAGSGTVIATRFWARPRERGERPARLDVTGFAVALAGQAECGDAWSRLDHASGGRVVVADGLGHGSDAAVASRRATELFVDRAADAPAAALERIHAGLRATRGAAAAVVDIDLERGQACYAGVGNITGVVAGRGAARNMVSYNGTLGHDARRIAEFTYAIGADAVIVLHSDGLSSRWTLDAYPGLAARRPAVIAGVLYRDFRRQRDDATVVVARAARGEAST